MISVLAWIPSYTIQPSVYQSVELFRSETFQLEQRYKDGIYPRLWGKFSREVSFLPP